MAWVRNEVRTLREDAGLSQGRLAEAMGVSRQTINSIENSRYIPSLPLAIALARHFGRSVEEVFHVDATHGDTEFVEPGTTTGRA